MCACSIISSLFSDSTVIGIPVYWKDYRRVPLSWNFWKPSVCTKFKTGFINWSLSISKTTVDKLLQRNTGLTICLPTFLSFFLHLFSFFPFLSPYFLSLSLSLSFLLFLPFSLSPLSFPPVFFLSISLY